MYLLLFPLFFVLVCFLLDFLFICSSCYVRKLFEDPSCSSPFTKVDVLLRGPGFDDKLQHFSINLFYLFRFLLFLCLIALHFQQDLYK